MVGRMRQFNAGVGEFMVQIGSLAMPVAPAILLGFGVYTTLPEGMGQGWKIAAALSAPIGATAVEFTTGKMFVNAWVEGRKREMRVAAAVALVSVFIITLAVLFLEAGNFQKILNVGLYVVSLASYVAQALNQMEYTRGQAEERQEAVQIRLAELEVEKARAEASGKRAEARSANAHSASANVPRTTATSANEATDSRYAPEVRTLHGMMNGDPFTRLTVEEKLGVKKTKAREIINAGVAMGLFADAGRNTYKAIHD